MNQETQTEEQEVQLFHFHLIVGNILFSFINENGNEQVDTLTVSAILKSNDETFNVSKFVKGQQNLQAVFQAKVLSADITVRDVIITNVCSLGWSTTEVFYQMPPEAAPQPAPAAEPTLETEVGTITESDVIRTPEDLAAALKQ